MKVSMDAGEIELSDDVLLSNSDSSSNVQPPNMSIDSFLDDLFRNAQTCTHTHTCNPPGPDATHTHTCYHTHTQLIPSPEEPDPLKNQSPVSKPRRALGNREAVRKYREKKKAHAVYLEEEVKKLRLVNQQLMRKLQRQGILETEILRLRGLLLELRGKIDKELGEFPFQKQCNSIDQGKCGVEITNGNGGCGNMMINWETDCHPATVGCQANTSYVEKCLQDSTENLVSFAPQEE